MSSLIGRSLGRYHILEKLGEGGMATVYKAYDTRDEREVAIKIIRAELFGSAVLERIYKRFEREARSLEKLSHPNIVNVIEYGEHEGSPFLVMEYIPGGTLKQKLGKPIPWTDALKLLIPIANALDYAHKNKIIHRDVKPSNILITEQGELKLTDFGIAKILESDEGSTLATTTGVGIGTPEYMAPEQGMGRDVDARADIYSLGIVLYELITGRKPFRADTPMAVVLKHVNDPLPRPSQYVKNIPELVENLLLKALAKQPENRFRNMSELLSISEDLLLDGRSENRNSRAIKRPPSFKSLNVNTTRTALTPAVKTIGIVGVLFMLIWISSTYILKTDRSTPPTESDLPPILQTSNTSTPTATLTPSPSPTHTAQPTSTQTPFLLPGSVYPIPTLPNKIIVLDSGDGSQIVLVYIPPGVVTISGNGITTHESGSSTGFYMSIYEITWGQIQTFLNSETTPDDVKDRVLKGVDWPDNYAAGTGRSSKYFFTLDPIKVKGEYLDDSVNVISYYGATGFTTWLSKRTGYQVRLPTVSEWEYAASGGGSNRFPWGNVWNQKMLNTNSDYQLHYGRVGLYPPNAFGLYDMCGNANEWTSDIYTGPNNYSSDWPNLVVYTLKGGGGRPEIGLGNPSTYCQIGYDDFEAANAVFPIGDGFRIVIDSK